MNYEDDLWQEALTQGEYMVMAINEYARAFGEEAPDSAWILTPFDTWQRNPYYNGPATLHPEAGDYE